MENNNIEDRKIKEAEFHDKIRSRELEKLNKEEFEYYNSNRKYYEVTRGSHKYLNDLIEKYSRGKRTLDYCCGEGDTAFIMAKAGASEAIGIDIAPESVEICKKSAEERGLSGNTKFLVMDAEKTEFPDNYFDFIVCGGVLHHLDVTRAYPELARILKKDGKIICSEPLVYNPIFQAYRRLTPQLRTEWEVNHILKKWHVYVSKNNFGKISEMRFFNLFTLVAVFFRGTFLFNPVLSIMEFVDSIILRLPGIKWWAWQIIYTLENPKDND